MSIFCRGTVRFFSFAVSLRKTSLVLCKGLLWAHLWLHFLTLLADSSLLLLSSCVGRLRFDRKRPADAVYGYVHAFAARMVVLRASISDVCQHLRGLHSLGFEAQNFSARRTWVLARRSMHGALTLVAFAFDKLKMNIFQPFTFRKRKKTLDCFLSFLLMLQCQKDFFPVYSIAETVDKTQFTLFIWNLRLFILNFPKASISAVF